MDTTGPETTQDPRPITVTVTGAAGQIGYAALFRACAGDLFGPQQPVRLRLLELPQAARAAHALISHVRLWSQGTPEGSWTSMAVASDGSYGVPEGIVSSFPVTCADGQWSIVPDWQIDDFARERIDRSVAELVAERDAVAAAGLLGPRS
ncbi:hypothetical protein [Kocuria palustris]|uniref:hypothetical protein n=1 Tax=Kocuria palustris TaxID=71999 RepID=UPI003BF7C1E9